MNLLPRAVVLGAALVGCFGEPRPYLPDVPRGDVTTDATPQEASVDVAPPTDAPLDLAPADVAPDAPVGDVEPDVAAMMDVPTADGVAPDAALDAPPDAAPDVAMDTSADLPRDLGPDLLADAPEVSPALIAAPRLIAPLSVTRVGRRARFAWQLAPDTDGAVVELCGDRACRTLDLTLVANGESVVTMANLAPGPHWWRARGRRGGVTGSAATPVWEFYVPPRRVSAAATAWGAVPDLNGDGRGDAVVTAPTAISAAPSTRGGLGYLFTGTVDSFNPTPAVTYNTVAPLRTGFGARVAPLLDVNGDGYADVAFGGTAHAILFYGAATPVPTPRFTWDTWSRAASAGDVNGDGYGDVLLTDGSRVAVSFGGPGGAAAPGARPFGGLGAVALGDVNADGYDDLAVLVAGDRVSVYFGSSVGISATAALGVDGPRGYVLSNLSLAGDASGDGVPDLVASATVALASAPSRAAVIYLAAMGVPRAATLLTPPTGVRVSAFGGAVGGAGDVNGDGIDDVVVGTGNHEPIATNQVCVFAGSLTGVGAAPLQCLTLPSLGRYGSSVGSACDHDRDGFEDILFGASGNAATLAGAVRFHRGRAAGLVDPAAATLTAGDMGAGFGADLAAWR
jgi:hypothetical protein